jgi:broad-specificity NMP kinase
MKQVNIITGPQGVGKSKFAKLISQGESCYVSEFTILEKVARNGLINDYRHPVNNFLIVENATDIGALCGMLEVYKNSGLPNLIITTNSITPSEIMEHIQYPRVVIYDMDKHDSFCLYTLIKN